MAVGQSGYGKALPPLAGSAAAPDAEPCGAGTPMRTPESAPLSGPSSGASTPVAGSPLVSAAAAPQTGEGPAEPPDGGGSAPEFPPAGSMADRDDVHRPPELPSAGSVADAEPAAAAAQHEVEPDAAATALQLEWMWGDAGVPGLSALAALNPMRWSRGSPEKVAAELEAQGTTARPVLLCEVGDAGRHQFATPAAAARWVRDYAVQDGGEQQAPGTVSHAVCRMAGMAAAPALAIFCRAQSRQPWPKRNIFAANSYARRVMQYPADLAAAQEHKDNACHPRRAASWEDFAGTRAAHLAEFVALASLPAPDRPRGSVRCDGKSWQLEDSGPYHVAYVTTSGEPEAVVAFCSGQGSAADAAEHLGSPARAFIVGEDETEVPDLPASLLWRLGSNGPLTIVGYSQGALVALGCALLIGVQPWLRGCVLLNCTTAFWPLWMEKLLGADWWSEPPPVSEMIQSWVVRGSPLSDSLPGTGRLPQAPGTTFMLPSRAEGRSAMENHRLSNFLSSRCE
eukprot:TRINITY_DN4265_c0_g1_i2.p1 TRINITY_DN4265_c0_g1~~TRINITY_DN4265_c0_g1_i2.p1  ORF type:complete len:535 (+),score=99.12 TRINITY_DN4265_c0_g1_i2:74-1606(+)